MQPSNLSSSTPDPNSPFTQGWSLVKASNEALTQKDYTTVRQHLAAYFRLGISRQGNLHSAILSIAVKLATLTPDFHLVPFLNLWNLSNLRPEDSDTKHDDSGHRIPSLVERLSKSYAYALLFHPDEHIEPELESIFYSLLQKKGFLSYTPSSPEATTPGSTFSPEATVHGCVTPLLATRLIQKEVRGRKMTFVSLITPDGTDLLTEVHTLTTFQRLRYDDIPGTIFDTLLHTSHPENHVQGDSATPSPVNIQSGSTTPIPSLRIEAAIPSRSTSSPFPLKVGFVEHIDLSHGHIHIFDDESRHFVSEQPLSYLYPTSSVSCDWSQNSSRIQPKVGDYVLFFPIIPKTSTFRTAIIRSILSLEQGRADFGFRKAKVTYTSHPSNPQASPQSTPQTNSLPMGETNGKSPYSSWELLPSEDGTIHPIIETGTTSPSFTKGYISQSLATTLNKPLPPAGTIISILVYLKRGKDRQKRPHVIYFE